MQTFTGDKAIHALTWTAARPAARRVRPLAVLATLVVVAGAAVVAVRIDSIELFALAPTIGGYLTWRVSRHLLAAHAVRDLRDKTPLRAVTLARLVARGTAAERGTHYVAVQDAHRVVITTTAPGAPPELPISVITQLGGSGGGGM